MSRNAIVVSSSSTMLAGAARATILQKMQSGSRVGNASAPSLLRRGSQDAVGDDELLDLVRALVEPEDPRVPIVSLDVEVPAEAVPAVDLDRPVRDPLCHLRAVEFRHRDLHRVVEAEVPNVPRA